MGSLRPRTRALWAIILLTVAAALPVTSAATQGLYVHAMWRVTTRSSSRPTPQTALICLNFDAPAEVLTCAGSIAATKFPGASRTVSCQDGGQTNTTATSVSKDGETVRDRDTRTLVARAGRPHAASPASWSESTMTYEGACNTAQSDNAFFSVLKPDGTIVDPFKPTACMVEVLKTVEGVSAPTAGIVREAGAGPLPFVRYTYPNRQDHKSATITYTATGDLGDPQHVVFETQLGGLFSPKDSGPDDYGASKFLDLWKDRCGVRATILFV